MDCGVVENVGEPWYVYVRWRNWKDEIRQRVVGVSSPADNPTTEKKAVGAALKACVWGWWTPSRKHGRGYRVSLFDHQDDLIEVCAMPRSQFDAKTIRDVYAGNHKRRSPNGSTLQG